MTIEGNRERMMRLLDDAIGAMRVLADQANVCREHGLMRDADTTALDFKAWRQDLNRWAVEDANAE